MLVRALSLVVIFLILGIAGANGTAIAADPGWVPLVLVPIFGLSVLIVISPHEE